MKALQNKQQTEIENYSDADVKKYICPNATDKEFFEFLQIAKARKLNPFLKEIYFVKYGNSPGNIIVGKDAVMKRGQQKENYRGFKAGWFDDKGNKIDVPIGNIQGAWCEIYDAKNEPTYSAVLMREYNSGKSTWKQIPATMIRKVAICHAFREYAPEETAGMYEAEEMHRTMFNKEKEINPMPGRRPEPIPTPPPKQPEVIQVKREDPARKEKIQMVKEVFPTAEVVDIEPEAEEKEAIEAEMMEEMEGVKRSVIDSFLDCDSIEKLKSLYKRIYNSKDQFSKEQWDAIELNKNLKKHELEGLM